MTMTLPELLLINSLWIWGLYAICQVEFIHNEQLDAGVQDDTKEIGWRVKVWVVKRFGWWWSKPIIVCAACMGSLHSLYFYLPYLYLTGFTWIGLLIIVPYSICLVGFNYLIAKLTHR